MLFEFSARFGIAIIESGLSQSEFARQLGVSPGFISDVVHGKKKPGTEFLHAVQTTFGISIDWLLTGKGAMNGRSEIDLEIYRLIKLQVTLSRLAVIDDNPTAKLVLRLIDERRLTKDSIPEEVRAFLDNITPISPEERLALELYNGHLRTKDPADRQRGVLASAMTYFETNKPFDKVAALAEGSSRAKSSKPIDPRFRKLQ